MQRILGPRSSLGSVGDEEPLSLTSRIILGLVCVLISLASLVDNAVFWLVVLQTRSLITGANVLLLCLSATDILVSVTSMPLTAYNIFGGRMQMSHMGCVIAGYMASLCMVATTFSIAAITVNRYIRVCHGRKYDKCCASGGIATTIACVWLAAALLVVPLADGWSTVKYTPDTFFCIAQCDTKVYCAIRLTLAISIPLLVMVICYGCIIKHVYNSKRGPRRTEEGQLASPHVSQRLSYLTHLRRSLDSNKLWWWRRVSLSMTVEPADIGLSQTSHTVPSTMPHPSGYNSESPVHLSLEDPIIEETEEDLQHYLESPKPSSPNLSFLGFAVNSMKSAEICQPVKLKDSLLKLKQLQWVQEEIKLVTSIGIIIGVYIFSYIPVVTMLNINKAYEGLIPKEIVVISVLILYANSIYNPIIYGARNRNIREGYIKLLAGTNRRTENISA